MAGKATIKNMANTLKVGSLAYSCQSEAPNWRDDVRRQEERGIFCCLMREKEERRKRKLRDIGSAHLEFFADGLVLKC